MTDKGPMTLDEAVEGLYDLEKHEQIALALEAMLIAHGPNTFIVYQAENGDWLTHVPGVHATAVQVSTLVRNAVASLYNKMFQGG